MSVALSVLTMARLCSIRSHLTTEAVLSSRQEGTTNANYRKSLDQYPVDTGRLRRVVEVVAERSGFCGSGHLCVVFRQDTSTTPTAYRRQVRNPTGHE